jgi:tetratricopeptide (TPR) repeat protein
LRGVGALRERAARARTAAKAAEAAERALERDASSTEAHYERGLALSASNRHGDAVPHLRKVVDKDRAYHSGDALFALGQAQEGSGDVKGRARAWKRSRRSSSRPEVLFLLARVQGCAATARPRSSR